MKQLLKHILTELEQATEFGVGLHRLGKLIPKIRVVLDSEQPMDKNKLNSEIMNIKCDPDSSTEFYQTDFPEDFMCAIRLAYKIGHRDARHAAAELVLKGGK